MALTGRRLRELRKEELRAVPLDLAGPRRDFAERGGRMAGWAPWGLLTAWVAFIALAIAIEPAPTRPEAESLWSGLWAMAMMGTLVATGVGLARRERSGFVLSAVAGGVALFGAVMCPVSGHHAVGAWWFVQMAGFAALGAISVAGLRLFRSVP